MARICSLGKQVTLVRRVILGAGDPIGSAVSEVDSGFMELSVKSPDSSSLSCRICQ